MVGQIIGRAFHFCPVRRNMLPQKHDPQTRIKVLSSARALHTMEGLLGAFVLAVFITIWGVLESLGLEGSEGATINPDCLEVNDRAMMGRTLNFGDTPGKGICEGDQDSLMGVLTRAQAGTQGRQTTYIGPGYGAVRHLNKHFKEDGKKVPTSASGCCSLCSSVGAARYR